MTLIADQPAAARIASEAIERQACAVCLHRVLGPASLPGRMEMLVIRRALKLLDWPHHWGNSGPVQRVGFVQGQALAAPTRERFANGPAPCLEASARAQVVACLRQQPDATLDELRVWVAALGGPAMSPATMGRAVQALDWRQKESVHAAQRDNDRVRALRTAYLEALQTEDFTRFKFVDKTSTT
jgi:hypothetical protein